MIYKNAKDERISNPLYYPHAEPSAPAQHRISLTMAKRSTYSFKSTALMDRFMLDIMEQRNLDRTSVIKLALYLFACYSKREDVRQMNLHQLVEDLNARGRDAAHSYGSFGDFCDS